jgi:hypothetical protein
MPGLDGYLSGINFRLRQMLVIRRPEPDQIHTLKGVLSYD